VVVPPPPTPEPPPTPPPAPTPVPPPPKEKPPETRPAEPPKPARAVLASLGRIQGDVQVTSPSGRRPAVAGEGLAAEEGLEAVGRAVVEFPDGSRLEIGPDTTIERVVEKQGRRILALNRG